MVDFVLKMLRKLIEISPTVAKFFVPKDVQCSETYAKSIIRFLFVEILSILYIKISVNWDLRASFANLNQKR